MQQYTQGIFVLKIKYQMNCVTIVKIAQSSENCLTWVTLYLLGLFRYISKFKIKKIEFFRGMTDIPVISIVYKSKLVNHFCKIIIISIQTHRMMLTLHPQKENPLR